MIQTILLFVNSRLFGKFSCLAFGFIIILSWFSSKVVFAWQKAMTLRNRRLPNLINHIFFNNKIVLFKTL